MRTVNRRIRAALGVEWHDTWAPLGQSQAAQVARLPALQRLLLTTDGTMTTALAALVGEPIGVRLLDQRMDALSRDDDDLSLRAGDAVLERRALLHGVESGAPLLLGTSRIVADRLPPPARAALIGGDVAIGLVLRAHEIESFRVPLSVGVKPARGEAALHLGAGPMCWRRYLIKAGGRPLMSVDEQFSAAACLAARR